MVRLTIFLLLILPMSSFAQPRKDFKKGTFGIEVDGEVRGDYTIIRKGRKQIEKYQEFTSVYKMRWISDYAYILEFVESDNPENPGGHTVVNISSVRENEYTAIIDLGEGRPAFKVIIFRIE